jgi:hypothetical protein
VSIEPVDLEMQGQDPAQILTDALASATIVYEAILKDAQKKGDIELEVRAEKQLEEARNWLRIFNEKHVMIAVGVE